MKSVDLVDIEDRLALITKYADGLTDCLSDEGWSLAYCIREMAKGDMTPAEAEAWMES